ncbi:hypothetical protein EGW08_010541 [Elysia chlorotica]|uniref:Transmembrane protein 186 n=1 Tax=Elysia chlorotica TaxID=188477 RepID=A0A433TJC4_ELYCH|nr:hypothetical protein EGW08_010541 [Elysia chlorotica]
MFSIVKLTVRTRTYSVSCFRQQSWQLWTGRRPSITQSNLQKPSVLTARFLKLKPGPRFSLKPQYKWDNVPASYEIVYESALKNYISSLYIGTALVGVSTSALVVLRWKQLLKNISYMDGIYLMGVSSLILLTLGIAYHFARTVIIRIYYNPDSGQFAAVRRTCLGRKRQILYYPREVKLKNVGKITNKDIKQSIDVKIQDKDYYLNADGFSSPIYYNAHIGADDGHQDLSKLFVSGPRF